MSKLPVEMVLTRWVSVHSVEERPEVYLSTPRNRNSVAVHCSWMAWATSHFIPYLRVLLLALMLAFILGSLSELPALMVALFREVLGRF